MGAQPQAGTHHWPGAARPCSVLGPVGHNGPHPGGLITDQEDPQGLTEPRRRYKGQENIPLQCTNLSPCLPLPSTAGHIWLQTEFRQHISSSWLSHSPSPAHDRTQIITCDEHEHHPPAPQESFRATAEKQRASSVVLNSTRVV